MAIYDAGRREPIPLPIKTSYAWAAARHCGDDPVREARYRWKSSIYPARTRSPRTCGRGARTRALADLMQPLRPGEECDGEDNRLGAYAARLWLPMLRAREGADLMERFDLLGPLPAERSTTVLEASAGTGKTFALAGLVTRYLAEGEATLDQMLLITFGRAASQELRERVRRQIVDAVVAFDDPSTVGDNQLVAHLLKGTDEQRAERKQRLRDALAGFDAATIATTHQFCQLVLKSLGVAGDTAASVTLVGEPRRAGHRDRRRSVPGALRAGARRPGAAATATRCGWRARWSTTRRRELRPLDPRPGSRAAVCVDFAKDVLAELDTRKRRLGVLGYDDLLIRLADALAADDSPARVRMHQRWPIVMVDEFQDTDPVQWQVIDRAFSGRSHRDPHR